MKQFSIISLYVLALSLAGCGPSDPEAGLPLKLAEQVTVSAFETLQPTVVAWESLMPEDYNPEYQEFPWMQEDGEAAMEQTLEETPLVEDFDGQEVKVSGYVVPLDSDEEAVREFLLVPFLGACTHVPPPPANQIVYVKPKYPLLAEEAWDVVSVVGTLDASGVTSDYGAAGYQMIDPLLSKFDETEYSGINDTPVVVDGDVQPDAEIERIVPVDQ